MIGKARATFWDNLPAQNDKSFKSKAYLYSGNNFVWLVDVYNKPFLGFKMCLTLKSSLNLIQKFLH